MRTGMTVDGGIERLRFMLGVRVRVSRTLRRGFSPSLDSPRARGVKVRLGRDAKNPALNFQGRDSKENVLVEVTGLEPVTSSLRTKRSTGLSYTRGVGQATSRVRRAIGPMFGRAAVADVR